MMCARGRLTVRIGRLASAAPDRPRHAPTGPNMLESPVRVSAEVWFGSNGHRKRRAGEREAA